MSDENVVTKITVEGADQSAAAFREVGDAAAQGFSQVDAEAARMLVAATKIENAFGKIGPALRNVGTAAQQFASNLGNVGKNITRAGAQLGKYTAIVTGFLVVAQRLGQSQDRQVDSSKELQQQIKQETGGYAERQQQLLQNEKAVRDLNNQFGQGKISVTEYAKQYQELLRSQREEAEMTRRSNLIRQAEEEDRLRRTEAMKKEQAEQKAFAESVRLFGADMANGLLQFGTAWERLMQLFNQGPSVIGDALRSIADFMNRNGAEIVALWNKVGDAFAKVFDDGKGKATDWGEKVMGFVRGVADIVTNVLIPAFKGFLGVLDTIAAAVNGIFGTKFSGAALAAVAIVLSLTGAFKVLFSVLQLGVVVFRALAIAMLAASTTPIGLAITAIVVALTVLIATMAMLDWEGFKAKAKAAVDYVIAAFNTLVGIPGRIGQWFTDAGNAISTAWNNAVTYVQTKWAEFMAWLGARLTDIGQWFADLWNGFVTTVQSAMSRAASALKTFVPGLETLIKLLGVAIDAWKDFGKAQGQSGSTTPAFAGGGAVHGPGTTTSDSILARLSRGEFVIKAAAVKKYGVAMMAAINGMRFNRNSLRGFSMGGLVSAIGSSMTVPRFAAGGLAASGRSANGTPVNLFIGDEQFSLFAQESTTADRLNRYAVKRRTASSGRKPSYMGGGG